MAYDTGTADRTRQIMSSRNDVVERGPFGGLAFMVKGSLCCSGGMTVLVLSPIG
jgi:hypothetical protein